MPRGWIVPQAVAVVHIRVAAEATERRLAKQPDRWVLAILPGSRVHQMSPSQIGRSWGVVDLAEWQVLHRRK